MKKTILIRCPHCGHISRIVVDGNDYFDWMCGGLAQKCFPYLNSSERELIISGLCFKCQDKVFGSDENEDYEPADIDDDCGFDPYMGCFTDDC